MEWQPIETAPKDGRAILGLFNPKFLAVWAETIFCADGLWCFQQDGDSPIDQSIITHWSPFDPPKVGE